MNIYVIILRHCKLYIQSFKSKPEDGFWKLKHVAVFSWMSM